VAPPRRLLHLRKTCARFNMGDGSMRVLLILFVVPAFALGLVVGATRVVGQPAIPPAQATALVWANRVFTRGHDLDSWLKSRGSSYEQWATHHPSLATTFPLSSKRPVAKEAVAADTANQPGWWNVLLECLVIGSGVTLLLCLLEQRRPTIRARRPVSTREVQVTSPAIEGAGVVAPPLLMKVSRALGREAPQKTTPVIHDSLPEPVGVEVAANLVPAVDRISAVRRSWQTVSMRFARIAPGAVQRSRAVAVRHPLSGRAGAVVRYPLSRRIRRRYLPRIAFYVAAIVLAFAIGAAISSYLN
jgi:hypothetical protein